MKYLAELYASAKSRVAGPICISLGSPWPVTQLVTAVRADHPEARIVCFQMDAFIAMRLREKLEQEKVEAAVVLHPDLWDIGETFQTVLFPAASQADRELKVDIVEQSYHILHDGGTLITLSEYEKDTQFAKWMKRVYGKAGETPTSKIGMAFWSTRTGEQPRRRHAQTFHAKIGDGPSLVIETWPGTFSYGEMDAGSRAMLEVAEVHPGDHVLDLGCGNGSVGCLASTLAENVTVTFIDSNIRATELTRRNIERNTVANTHILTSPNLEGLTPAGYDLILANPPYYANSEVARLFISQARDLLKPAGRFVLVTKMPVQTIPEIVESFGDVESIDNRGYTVLTART